MIYLDVDSRCNMIFIVIVFLLVLIYATHNSILESIPLIFGAIFYFLILTVVMFIFILNLIKLFVKQKKNVVKTILNLFISLILVVIIMINYNKVFDSLKKKGYLYTNNYKKVKENLDITFKNNYKILGVKGKNIKINDTTCEYVYDVNLNDNSDIIFQAYYCPFGYFGSFSYSFSNNYEYYYLPYYLNLYKKYNDVTFRIENSDDIYSDPTIVYNNFNSDEVMKFLYYFDDNIAFKRYQIIIRNEDTNSRNYIYSKNDFNFIR